ncbi:diguanylate cyclase domain-containing protein [Desulfuromonas thiophila]|uniref:diguanylate cyclase domain-containing protein n=1 Tax=Desulfuromonas thiophila TaxID=57664 RepID=UPI0024A84C23|nr:diguanylate cyclase [Desulfuromonas thiophila]
MIVGQTQRRQLLALFASLFGGAAVLLTAVTLLLLQQRTAREFEALCLREQARVQVASSVLERRLENHLADLRFLAATPLVRQLLEQDNPARREALTRLLCAFVTQKGVYDQARVLDATGQERLRIDLRQGEAVVVPAAQLQNKSGRYYVADALRLAPGQIYISPLDLNIERGRIEEPYKPMIRLATPLFGANGQCSGLLVLNLLGNSLLERFRQLMGSDVEPMLLNRTGDFLVAPQPQLEWGFMFDRPAGFPRRYPAAWRQMQTTVAGHWRDGEGLFSFRALLPLTEGLVSSSGSNRQAGTSAYVLAASEYRWRVVSRIAADRLPAAGLVHHPLALLLYGGGLALLLPLSALLARLLVGRRLLLQQVRHQARHYREITDTLAEGLVVLDGACRLTEINPEAARLLGWSREELIGAEAHQIFRACRGAEAVSSTQRCGLCRIPFEGTVYRSEDEELLCRDGRRLPVGLSAAPLTDEAGVSGAVVAFRDLRAIKAYQAEIEQLAFHDSLTGLPNRRLLLDRLERALALAGRTDRCLALLFLDLDHFKQINDTYGHEGGDALLREVARRLLQAVRQSDTVCRQGGDEFVLLLTELTFAEDAAQVARKILQGFRQPVALQGQQVQVKVSIGIALYPAHGQDSGQLMQQADEAMYRAKQAGRNRYAVAGAAPCTLDDPQQA